jgi:hypothetical protein
MPANIDQQIKELTIHQMNKSINKMKYKLRISKAPTQSFWAAPGAVRRVIECHLQC